MCIRDSIRTVGARPISVDMDPLVVLGGVSELVNSFLSDLFPPADSELLADQFARFLDGPDYLHNRRLSTTRIPGVNNHYTYIHITI